MITGDSHPNKIFKNIFLKQDLCKVSLEEFSGCEFLVALTFGTLTLRLARDRYWSHSTLEAMHSSSTKLTSELSDLSRHPLDVNVLMRGPKLCGEALKFDDNGDFSTGIRLDKCTTI